MITSNYNIFKYHFTLIVFFLLLYFLIENCFSDEITINKESINIFVNSSVPEKKYTLDDARAIFAMRKIYWSDGSKIQVFVFSDSQPLHRKFSKNTLGMFPYQFRRIWDRIVFSGTGQAPNQVKSTEEMLKKIIATPGAIGYLNERPKNNKVRLFFYE